MFAVSRPESELGNCSKYDCVEPELTGKVLQDIVNRY